MLTVKESRRPDCQWLHRFISALNPYFNRIKSAEEVIELYEKYKISGTSQWA